MELGFGVEVITEPLALEPTEQPPLGRQRVTLRTPLQRIVDPRFLGHVIEQFGPVERQRRVVLDREMHVQVAGVAMQVLASVDGRLGRELLGMNVVAATSEVVVAVPVDVGRQHRDVVFGLGRRHDPREGEELA